MSVVGEFTVPAGSFALEHALSSVPATAVEADRLASHSTMEVLPFLWAAGGDADAFQRALSADESVQTATVAEETGDEVLYRLEWSQEFRDLINDMVDHHAAITEARARAGRWYLQLRFAEESMISEFQTHFRETGRTFTVETLSRPTNPRERAFGLTPDQYDALVAGVRAGYFQVPRNATVEELGAELGVSANAVSQRLRRGTDTLVRRALTIDDESDVVADAEDGSGP